MLNFLYTPVSWVLLRWHQFFTLIGLDAASGVNWALSIIFLVITARLLLFRLFVKQVKYQRDMAKMQPRIQALREKYKNDKPELQRQMMKLQQEEGFNPLSGCLPLFLQWPIFIALYHVLKHIAGAATLNVNNPANEKVLTLYTFTKSQTEDAAHAKLFGAPMAAKLRDSTELLHTLGATGRGSLTVVILVLVILSATATFTTQRLVRAGAVTTPEGTAATVQRLMLYAIPVFTLGSGLFFPLGVLLYWFASNTWTMLQQAYINRFHPHEDKNAPAAGTLGKTLAPKPGQRPKRDTGRPAAKGGTATRSELATDTTADVPPPNLSKEPAGSTSEARGEASAGGSAASNAPRRKPAAGQRPNRPSGNRPPAKRTSQSKKRR